MIQQLLLRLFTKPAFNKIITDPECSLLTAHRGFKLADPDSNPANSKEGLNPVGKIARDRNLDTGSGIVSYRPGTGGNLECSGQSLLEGSLIHIHRNGSLLHHI
jgi:hypothetical protein